MLEYSFSVRHEGCWTADINDEFPDVTATILQSHAFTDSSSTMIEVDGVDERRTEDIVDWMDDHPVVRTVDLLRHADGTGLVSFQTDYSDTDTEPVGTVFRERPCIPLSSAEVRNGFEHCHIMMASKEQIRTTYDELCEYGPVEVRSFGELDSTVRADDLAAVSRAVSGLSSRQQQVLKRAIEKGYYEVPQACNVEDLAAEDPATMSTVAEHLRHAEQKILTAVEPLLSQSDG